MMKLVEVCMCNFILKKNLILCNKKKIVVLNNRIHPKYKS